MANRILLPNGCSMSTPSVNPKNWKSGGQTLIKKYWHVQYYFYDPIYKDRWPYGKLIVVKGMNEFKDLQERRDVTKTIIEDEIYENKRGFNPILRRYTSVVDPDQELHEDLPFIEAFNLVLPKLECSEKHRTEIRIARKRLTKAADQLKYRNITIGMLKRRDLKRLFEACKLTDNYFNKFRAYISRLFVELVEYECCETNLTRDIRRRKITVKEREILSVDHHQIVVDYLRENYYEFYRYAVIFFYSGARSSELFRVQRKDVDLENQEFKVMIKKGRSYKEVIKVILKEALPLWRELLRGSKSSDYIFSLGLKPGPKQIQSYQITKRWYRLVKNSDKIKDEDDKVIKVTADFYAMKHSFLDSLDEDVAQKMASHTNSKTTSIYRVNQNKRDREALKELDVKLKVV